MYGKIIFALSGCLLLGLGGCIVSQCSKPNEAPVAVQDGLPVFLEQHVRFLTGDCHPRSYDYPLNQRRVLDYLEKNLQGCGARMTRMRFSAENHEYENLSVLFPGRRAERIVVGAHYDSCGETPGADDNASAVAGLLELGRMLKGCKPEYSIELVFYANEEPPFFATEHMGSVHHASALSREGVPVRAMICLEMIGFFSDAPGSQSYPVPGMGLLYPGKGDFIAVVGNWGSVGLARQVQRSLTKQMPTVRLNMPDMGICLDFSDHRSYWAQGMPAVMVTDTAFFRNGNYHQSSDTPESLDYGRMAQVVRGVFDAVVKLSARE